MKLIRYMPFVSIVFCLLAVVAAADSNKKGKVTFPDHVMVSGTQLEPGEYLVRWNEGGPDSQITFLHDGKQVTSAIANVVQQKNPNNSFTTNLDDHGSRVLKQIAFSDVILVFTPGETSAPE